MNRIIDEIQNGLDQTDRFILVAESKQKEVPVNSTEYHYWRGVRMTLETTRSGTQALKNLTSYHQQHHME